MTLLDAAPPAPAPVVAPPLPTARRRGRPGELAAVVALLLLATALRVARLSLVQYKYDDDALFTIVTRMARTGHVPTAGLTSSIGLANGPFQAYLLAPFGWVGADPPLMTTGVALLNILGVAVVYAFARDFFGRRAALFALLLAAANPWAVVLSRRLLGNDMLFPFAALALWMLARWLFRRDGRAAVIAGAALAIAGQFYVLGLECLAPALAAAVLAGRRLCSRAALLGLLTFAALMAPYLLTQALPHAGTLLEVRGQRAGLGAFDTVALRLALTLAGNEGYQAFATQAGGRLDATGGLPAAFGLVARTLYLGGLGLGLWTLLRGPGRLRQERRGLHLLLLSAAAVPVLLLLRPPVAVDALYLVATLPLPSLYSGLALDRLWAAAGRLSRRWQPAGRGAVAAIAAGTLGMNLVLAGVFFSVIGQYWPRSDYGIPWQLNDQAGRESVQLQRQLGAERILVLDDASDFNQVEWVLAERGAPVGELDDRFMFLLPGRPTLILAPGDQPAQRELLADYHQYLVREQRWPGEGIMLRWYLLPPAIAAAPPAAGTLPLDWTAGGLLRLEGVAIPRRLVRGASVSVRLSLRVLRRPDAATPDFSVFAHLVGPDGAAVSGADQPAFRTRSWLPGDRIVQTLTLPPPSGANGLLSLALGVYATDLHGTTVRPLPLLDAAGHSLGASGTVAATVLPPPAPAAPDHPLAVQFAAGIALDGYDLAQAGDVLTVTPHWAADAAVGQDYTAFVHVLDGAGKLAAQDDAPPLAGRFPTAWWQPGDRIADPHRIALPAGLAAGDYRLEFGLYDPRTLQRLAVVHGQPQAAMRLPAG